jgi:hypothetical protein
MSNANTTAVLVAADAARNITGIASSLGVGAVNTDMQLHILINNGANAVTLKHEDGASAAANRFLCSTGADVVLSANQSATLIYDLTATRWRVFKNG